MVDTSILERLPRHGKNGPPAIENILLIENTDDLGYKLVGDLSGIKGTWHRLWGLIANNYLNIGGEDTGGAEAEEAVHDHLADLIGRRLLPSEYEKLRDHAQAHAEVVLKPIWQDQLKKLK